MLISVLIAVNQLHARLGESEAQIEERYGKPAAVEIIGLKAYDKSALEERLRDDKSYSEFGCKTYYYSFNGVRTSVRFLNNVSVAETYWKKYSLGELQAILQLNDKDAKWTVVTDSKDVASGVRVVRWTNFIDKFVNYQEGDDEGLFNIWDKRFSDLLDKMKETESQKQSAEKDAIIKDNLKGY
jgi:hypothetical protein